MEEITYCPRCQGVMPNEETPGAHRGALSRYDSTTYVCDNCGVKEALYVSKQDGLLPPPNQPVPGL